MYVLRSVWRRQFGTDGDPSVAARVHDSREDRWNRRTWLAPAFVTLILAWASLAGAAEPVVQVEADGPHFAGIPSVVRILVKGFDQEPEPQFVQPDATPGLQVELINVVPHVSQRIEIFNGRQTNYSSVVYDFRFRMLADKPGAYTAGPFYIQQGQTRVTHQAIDVKFEDIAADKDTRVLIKLPDRAVYPGERVLVEIQWWYASDTDNIRNLTVRSQLFDQFNFIEEKPDQRDQLLPIQTAKGSVGLKAKVSKETFGGRSYIVLTASPQFIPDKPGEFNFPPTVATMNKVVRWRRDFFRGKVPAATVPTKSTGQAVRLVVRPYPREGRPESFVGAVGNGFAMEVTADRTVVRVGDPIGLTVRVRGEGRVENISLPPLNVDGGMSADRFRLPAGELAGTLEDGVKTFPVSVRVLDANVREIPALAFSWFNPNTETYQTTHSAPIALRVEEAELVTAADVVSRAATTDPQDSPKTDAGATDQASHAETAPGTAVAHSSAHHADLSIEVSPERLLTNQRPRISETLAQAACYLGGLTLLMLAVWDRRRRLVDPQVARQRQNLREHQQRIQSAAGLPRDVAAKRIADSLRAVAASANAEQRSRIEPLIAQCEEIIYVPEGGNGELVQPEFVARAAGLTAEILQETA